MITSQNDTVTITYADILAVYDSTPVNDVAWSVADAWLSALSESA